MSELPENRWKDEPEKDKSEKAKPLRFDITDYLAPIGYARMRTKERQLILIPIYEFPEKGTPEAQRIKRAALKQGNKESN